MSNFGDDGPRRFAVIQSCGILQGISVVFGHFCEIQQERPANDQARVSYSMHDLLIILRICEMQDILRACQDTLQHVKDIFFQNTVILLGLEDVHPRHLMQPNVRCAVNACSATKTSYNALNIS